MIVRKLARALCVLAALSLVGCVVDATGEVDEGAAIGEASSDLTDPDDDQLLSDDEQLDEGDLGDGEGDEESQGWLPANRLGEVVEPHPDPWMNDVQPEASESPEATGGSQD
jgi:hypothetical protein